MQREYINKNAHIYIYMIKRGEAMKKRIEGKKAGMGLSCEAAVCAMLISLSVILSLIAYDADRYGEKSVTVSITHTPPAPPSPPGVRDILTDTLREIFSD